MSKLSSLFPSIPNLYRRQSTKFAECVSVSIVLPFDQDLVNVTSGGWRFVTTVPVFIALLNVTTTVLSTGTSPAPAAGSSEVRYGALQTISKTHGFGTGPATSELPAMSVPPVISILYWVHWFKTMNERWRITFASHDLLTSVAVGVIVYVTESGTISSLK